MPPAQRPTAPAREGYSSSSSGSTASTTCASASSPPALPSPTPAEPARCRTSARRSARSAQSSPRSPRCPTAAPLVDRPHITRHHGGYNQPGKVYAVGPGGEARPANRLVYSAGMDLHAAEGATPNRPGLCDLLTEDLPATGRRSDQPQARRGRESQHLHPVPLKGWTGLRRAERRGVPPGGLTSAQLSRSGGQLLEGRLDLRIAAHLKADPALPSGCRRRTPDGVRGAGRSSDWRVRPDSPGLLLAVASQTSRSSASLTAVVPTHCCRGSPGLAPGSLSRRHALDRHGEPAPLSILWGAEPTCRCVRPAGGEPSPQRGVPCGERVTQGPERWLERRVCGRHQSASRGSRRSTPSRTTSATRVSVSPLP